MAVFTYRATDARRSAVAGTICADTPRQARDLLRGRGLTVRDMAAQETANSQGSFLRNLLRKRSGQPARVAGLIRELSTLLGVGIPLAEALDTLVRQQKGHLRTAILIVRDRVLSGASLAEAMAEQPEVFDTLAVRMVEVGEASGSLDRVLDQLADYRERSLQLKDQVLTALLYPGIIFSISVVVSLFLMTFVVPMLLDNLLSEAKTLPWPTRVLKGASDLLIHYGWLLGIGAVLAGIVLVSAMRTTRGRRLWHGLLLKIPLIGPMALKQSIARMALVMATLMRSGVVYLTALEIAARAMRNVVLREALEESEQRIMAGEEIGQALERSGVFPPLVIHLFAVGQQAGRLEEMLERLARDYDQQVTSLSTRLTSTLEPILILTLSIFVGFILFATFLPILEASNVL